MRLRRLGRAQKVSPIPSRGFTRDRGVGGGATFHAIVIVSGEAVDASNCANATCSWRPLPMAVGLIYPNATLPARKPQKLNSYATNQNYINSYAIAAVALACFIFVLMMMVENFIQWRPRCCRIGYCCNCLAMAMLTFVACVPAATNATPYSRSNIDSMNSSWSESPDEAGRDPGVDEEHHQGGVRVDQAHGHRKRSPGAGRVGAVGGVHCFARDDHDGVKCGASANPAISGLIVVAIVGRILPDVVVVGVDEPSRTAVAMEVEAPQRRVEARDPPPTEEEKVKEVLSETPSARARPRPRQRLRRVDGAVAPSVERGGEKVRAKGGGGGGGGRVRDGSRARRVVGAERATSEKSEAASESSVATTATGPERSPGKPARKRAVVSGELGRARQDRGPAAPGAGRPGGGRASPSPPWREPVERPARWSPSPAAKRAQDQRRAGPGATAGVASNKTVSKREHSPIAIAMEDEEARSSKRRKTSSSSTVASELPDEMPLEILARLSAKSIGRFPCVSR
ncbi:hypothetical protein E2562_030855 [Oryza meyeriana var. granulata]|uniref:F-box domain-containing protein n=1 Tax=Oryza meyeriana var. granulata TaxID=110450 RepID=A0A6G1EZX2_9ORYZ|nr:hypothetical protein E2562_030855 [Oryza meyeriana var. granulata]